MHSDIRDLFDGHLVLGRVINVLFNEHWDHILLEMKRPVFGSLAKIYEHWLTTLLDTVPYDDFFIKVAPEAFPLPVLKPDVLPIIRPVIVSKVALERPLSPPVIASAPVVTDKVEIPLNGVPLPGGKPIDTSEGESHVEEHHTVIEKELEVPTVSEIVVEAKPDESITSTVVHVETHTSFKPKPEASIQPAEETAVESILDGSIAPDDDINTIPNQ